MKKKTFLILALTCSLLMTGCSDKHNDSNSDNNTNSTGNQVSGKSDADGSGSETSSSNTASDNSDSSNTAIKTAASELDTSDLFSKRDYDSSYNEKSSVLIQLNGDSASCNSKAVTISGSTITIIDEGTYILSGTLNDGMIIIDSEKTDKTQLVLDGVSIHSETSAPLYILQSDKVFITLADGSVNTLSNGGTFTAIDENNIDAVIFSKESVALNGSGSLTITSPAGHGIVSKDKLIFTGGTYEITTASHGLSGKDNICMTGADIRITAGKDGIHAENTEDASLGYIYIQNGSFDISAEGDAISASANLQIDDGSFTIVAGGGSANAEKKSSDSWGGFMGGGMGGGKGGGGRRPDSQNSSSSTESTSEDSTSMKALKATANLQINNGSFTIDSADDALHSDASISINGATFHIATGDDGFHAGENLNIAAGNITITESYEGLEGLHITVSGGEISLVASDDGLNAAGGTDQSGFGGFRGNDKFGGGSAGNGSITISGGNLYVNASGDGIDANGSLTISGGFTTVCGPTTGDTATLDYDSSAIITGGTFIGTGASQMAQTFSDSEQGIIAVNVGNQSANTAITLTNAQGDTLISYAPELSYGVVILSSPDIVKGDSYTITIGSASATFEAN